MSRLGLFQGYGVELEYMIVDRRTLAVAPFADRLLVDEGGAVVSDLTFGDISWSNELVAHVLEMKTEGPAPSLANLAVPFQENVREVNRRLEPHGAMLMPGAAHPFMDPARDTRLWEHEYNEVYESYNRIFDCRGHGWSNLQSTHINLPFANDEEFGRLHAAIRLVLPLVPALAASSPVIEGKRTGMMDTRIDFYQRNQARVPSIIGRIVPEPVYTEADYRREILDRTYRDIAPLDTDGILQAEFLNSRGAIARFTRGAIEIRLMDIQECPAADIAIVQFLTALVQAHVEERFAPYAAQREFPTETLRTMLLRAVVDGEHAGVEEREYLELMGLRGTPRRQMVDLLRGLYDALKLADRYPESRRIAEAQLLHGTLARRIVNALRDDDTRPRIEQVYRRLATCLDRGILFTSD